MSSAQPIFPQAGPSFSDLRPSIWELVTQEQLRDLLHPVVRYILSYFAQRYPRYLIRVLNRHEAFFAALMLLVERHHLKKHNASLSEHFYQLRLLPSRSIPTPRLSALEPPQTRKLSRRQRWGLLIFLVGIPYIRAQTQDYYERLGGGADPDTVWEDSPQIAITRSERAFKLIYPYANLALDLTFLGYDLAYLFDRSDSYRPWHRWLGLRIERRGPANEQPNTNPSLLSRLPPLLPPLLLLLKLSEWWYSNSSPRTISPLTGQINSLSATHASILPPRPLPILPSSGLLPPTPPTTPPPDDAPRQEASAFQIGLEGYGKCPLCGKKWQNPAILPCGWVVCWRCGWDAVEGEEEEEQKDKDEGGGEEKQPRVAKRRGVCPITGVKVAPGELRRVLV